MTSAAQKSTYCNGPSGLQIPVATENRIRDGADTAMRYPRFGMLDLLKLLSGLLVGSGRHSGEGRANAAPEQAKDPKRAENEGDSWPDLIRSSPTIEKRHSTENNCFGAA